MTVSREIHTGDILLEVPAEEEALLVVRLAASGAASHGSFDMDTLEDIKTAVSEACYLMIHQKNTFERLRIIFSHRDALTIRVLGEGLPCICKEGCQPDTEVCSMVLGTLLDTIQIHTENHDIIAIEMVKSYA